MGSCTAPGGEGVDEGLRYIGAALAVGLGALGTGWAQSRIGSAGAGVIAEKPELAGLVLILIALPETLVILGFVIATLTLLAH